MGFWKWHNKKFWSTEPIMGIRHVKEDDGSEDLQMFFGGSRLRYQNIPDKKKRKMINCKDAEVIDYEKRRYIE